MLPYRRVEDGVGDPPAPGAIFGPEEDNAIPGEVIFALNADAAASIDVSVPSGPLRGAAAAGAAVTRLGATGVDSALSRLDVTSITRVHGASPPEVVRGVAIANDFGLDGTFRVRYGAATKVDTVVERLSKVDEVAWAEPSRYREATIIPNDPRFSQQWGLTRITCPDAWDRTTGSPSVTVAVVDTGVDLNHPELAPLLVAGQDLVDWPPGSVPRPGFVFEGDFMGVDADPQDEVGHGTHVAGTIACASNNGVGVAGVTWNTRLMPVRVLARIRETATGRISGAGSSANIAAGIRWAADHGAQIINMSLGGSGDARVERDAVAYAVARGVVVVAAMGNDNSSMPSYPAAYPDVIAVGATDKTDKRASFSNTGSWIDVSAPGVGVWSTYWDDTYFSLSGTSMASPHVAGVAAMIRAVAPTATAAQVGDILRSTARPLRDAPTDPVPNDRYGHGLVQAAAAVRAPIPDPGQSPWTTVAEGRSTPGAPVTAVRTGQNEIALFIADPNGGIYTISGFGTNWGQWRTVAEGRSAPGGHVTAVRTGQNEIALFIADPNGGIYTISGFRTNWGQWRTVAEGRSAPGAPVTALQTGQNEIALFIADPNGGIYTISGFGTNWGQWKTVAEGRSAPGGHVTAVRTGQNEIALFIADPNGGIYTISGFGTNWGQWRTVAEGRSTPGAPVTAVRTGQNEILFIADPNGGIYTISGFGTNWGQWRTVAEGRSAPGGHVTAVQTGQNEILFIADPNGGIYTISGFGTNWGQWRTVAEGRSTPGAPVTAVQTGQDRIDLFIADPNGGIYTSTKLLLLA